MSTSSIFDVIVVGAGISGLHAAASLKDRGHSVLVLESRSRLGGRIHSTRTASGLTIDLGAQLIGDSQTRISRLVDQFGLTRVPLQSQGWTAYHDAESKRVVYEQGDSLPLSALEKLDALQAMWRVDSKLRGFRSSLEKLDRTTASDFIDDLAFTDEATRALRSYAESELCCSSQVFSAYELLDQLASVGGTDGEADSAQWCLAEGMGAVIEGLAGPVLANIRLDAAVDAVNASADGYVVSCRGEDLRTKRLLVSVPPQLYGRMGLMHVLPPRRRLVLERYTPGSVVTHRSGI